MPAGPQSPARMPTHRDAFMPIQSDAGQAPLHLLTLRPTSLIPTGPRLPQPPDTRDRGQQAVNPYERGMPRLGYVCSLACSLSAGSTGSSATVPSPPATTSSPSATRPPSTSPPSESGSGLSLLRHGLGLDGRSHEDFADVDGVRLRDRERDRVGYCLRRHGHRVPAGGQQCEFAGVTSGGDEVGARETRRDECAAQALGSQFLSHYLAQGAYRGLGGGVNGLAGNPLVGGGGCDRDEVARSLGPEDRQGGGDTVQDAAQVHVDHLVPVIYLA